MYSFSERLRLFLGPGLGFKAAAYIEEIEKERDTLRGELERLKAENKMLWDEREEPHQRIALYISECNRLEAERDALRAELDALKAWRAEVEKQEPVAEVCWMAGIPNSMLKIQTYSLTPPLGTKFYAHPATASVSEVRARRLLVRAAGHIRWLRKNTNAWTLLHPKTAREAEGLQQDIDAFLAAAPEVK